MLKYCFKILIFGFLLSFFIGINNLYSQNIRDGVVGYWPLNCNYVDSSTSADPILTVGIGNPECIEGKLNEAIKLDGVGEYLEVDKARSLDLVSSLGFSWSVWFKLNEKIMNSEKKATDIIISYANPELQSDIVLGFGSNSTKADELSFIVDGPGGFGESAVIKGKDLAYKPEGGFEEDEWYHAVGIMDYVSKRVYLYVNGELVDSFDNHRTSPMTENMNFSFGGFVDGDTEEIFFNGGIDEVRIYERPLSFDEVLILYSARPEQLEADTNVVDFGNILCENERVLELPIINQGPSKFLITDYEFSVGSNFSIGNSSSITMEDKDTLDLSIVFGSNVSGTFYDTLFINNNNFIQPTIIYLSGIKDVEIDVVDEISFGKFVLCEDKSELSRTFTIRNMNVADGLLLESIEFSSSSFRYVDEEPDELILDEKSYEIVLGASDTLFFDEYAVISFSNCDYSRTFNLSATSTSVAKGFEENIDFGEVEIGGDSIIHFEYRNIGSADYEIINISQPEGLFVIDNYSGTFLRWYGQNDVLKLAMKFSPMIEMNSSSFTIETKTECGIELDTIYLDGVGRFRASFDLEIGDVEGEMGDTVEIPLIISNPVNFDKAKLGNMNLELEFNKTMLFPLMVDEISSVQVDKSIVRNEIGMPEENIRIDTVLFRAILTLGNRELDSVRVNEIGFENGLYSAKINNGVVRVSDICEEGGKRLFSATEFLYLSQPSPNPAMRELNLSFGLIEGGKTKLYIVDIDGNVVKILIDSNLEVGKYKYSFDIEKIPSGLYIYILETPNQMRSGKLQILD